MHADHLRLTLVAPRDVAVPLHTWLQRTRTRAVLRELDTRHLEDVGLSEIERQRECAKWFWEA